MKSLLCLSTIILSMATLAYGAVAQGGQTYTVGTGKQFAKLQDLANRLQPGDVVEVYGNAIYPGDIRLQRPGTEANKITIRGISVNGKRPVLAGGKNTIEFNGNHYIFENFEIRDATFRCVFHHAHDITVKDTVVHDCKHGILGADLDSGSLTLDRVEVYGCGSGTHYHQVYVATDESKYPGAVFRMQNSYLHDAKGGNNVKTRAERNEIYNNWIESSYYHDLELIGPDPESGVYGEDEAREDSDVVGNVIIRNGPNPRFRSVRIGGDGTGQTWGRYRFVNNTMIMDSSRAPVFFHHFGIESIEMHNNLFISKDGGGVKVWASEGDWRYGTLIKGSHNFVGSSSSHIPESWVETKTGNAGLADLGNLDFRPIQGSPLIDAGNQNPEGITGHELVNVLLLPRFHPPFRAAVNGKDRPVAGAPDIGAYEFGRSDLQPVVKPARCVAAIQEANAAWRNTALASQTGKFIAQWDVTPQAIGVDGAVALSQGEQWDWKGLGVIVRFNPENKIDVRNGSEYRSLATVAYTPGKTYRVKVIVDMNTRRYDAFVTPSGGLEMQLAKGFAFRSEQAGVKAFDHWTVNSVGAGGGLVACNFSVHAR